MAALALVVLLATTTYASEDDDLDSLAGATRTLAQAGKSRLVAARSDSKVKKGKTKCGLGHYRRSNGACTPCPVGTYKFSVEGKCEACPKGTTTAAPGSVKKSDCNGEWR
jgi:hypothetical protein